MKYLKKYNESSEKSFNKFFAEKFDENYHKDGDNLKWYLNYWGDDFNDAEFIIYTDEKNTDDDHRIIIAHSLDQLEELIKHINKFKEKYFPKDTKIEIVFDYDESDLMFKFNLDIKKFINHNKSYFESNKMGLL